MKNLEYSTLEINEFGEVVLTGLSEELTLYNELTQVEDTRFANVVGCGGGLNLGCK